MSLYIKHSVSIQPRHHSPTTPTPTPTTSPTKDFPYSHQHPPVHFSPTPPLDLGRDQLRTLMQESGMSTIESLPITREQLKYESITPDLFPETQDDQDDDDPDFHLDPGYEPYNILESDDYDDSESEEEREYQLEQPDFGMGSEGDIFEIDAEINDALNELGI
ncbi:UNVERIFIED_CONTAM: hypothetical protein HDU68_006182 [Siphonaria sp. JEL0065]|nr:hypothetical protein HDU68_006182 [Siphonaria sp. JEL0065]